MANTLADLVRMTTSTVGPGTITLLAKVPGFRSFVEAGIANGATVSYSLREGQNSEVGSGVYNSAAQTLTRVPTASTNSNNAIALLGNAEVIITALAADFAIFRERLSAARTYYVRTDGSDSNTGLADTAAGAFLTPQKAIDTVATLDLSIYDATIQLGAGTYAIGTGLVAKDLVGAGYCVIIGDETTPSNVVLNQSGAVAVNTHAGIYVKQITGKYKISGVKFTSSATGSAAHILASGSAYIEFKAMDFGDASAATAQQIRVEDGGIVKCTGNYSVTAASNAGLAHVVTTGCGIFRCQGFTVTIVGTPTYQAWFNLANASNIFFTGFTVVGSMTGTKWFATLNAILITGGLSANIPGSIAGSTATGAQVT